jgi:hypothetical protein
MATAIDPANVEEFLPAVLVLLRNVTDCMLETKNAVLDDGED